MKTDVSQRSDCVGIGLATRHRSLGTPTSDGPAPPSPRSGCKSKGRRFLADPERGLMPEALTFTTEPTV